MHQLSLAKIYHIKNNKSFVEVGHTLVLALLVTSLLIKSSAGKCSRSFAHWLWCLLTQTPSRRVSFFMTIIWSLYWQAWAQKFSDLLQNCYWPIEFTLKGFWFTQVQRLAALHPWRISSSVCFASPMGTRVEGWQKTEFSVHVMFQSVVSSLETKYYGPSVWTAECHVVEWSVNGFNCHLYIHHTPSTVFLPCFYHLVC